MSRAEAARDAADRIVKWYGTTTEIEEMVAVRKVLAQSRVALEAAVAERTTALRERECGCGPCLRRRTCCRCIFNPTAC